MKSSISARILWHLVPAVDRSPSVLLFAVLLLIDQIRFLQSILDPPTLLRRIELYCRDENEAGRLPKGSYPVPREALLQGSVERGGVPALVALRERAARNVTAELLSRRLLVPESPRAALRLAFPTDAVERWFPSLYSAAG